MVVGGCHHWRVWILELLPEIWKFDHALAVIAVLSLIGFVSTTVLLVSKLVRGVIGSGRQVHPWLRDSGRLTDPTSSTPELGPEAPAVVNLLVTRGRLSRDAVRATVLDLAARGVIALHQPVNDATATVVMAIRPSPGELTAYEKARPASECAAGAAGPNRQARRSGVGEAGRNLAVKREIICEILSIELWKAEADNAGSARTGFGSPGPTVMPQRLKCR